MSNSRTQERPFGVSAIVGLQILSAIVVIALFYLAPLQQPMSRWFHFPETADLPAVISYVTTLFGFVIAPGLWRLKRWAWVLTMIQLGFRMGAGLFVYFTGDAQYFLMFINIITVFYLNQRDVQRAFGHDTSSMIQINQVES